MAIAMTDYMLQVTNGSNVLPRPTPEEEEEFRAALAEQRRTMTLPLATERLTVELTKDSERILSVLLFPRTPVEAAWVAVLRGILEGKPDERLAAAMALADLVKQELEG